MKIVITGCSGEIGKRLASRLAKKNYVLCLNRRKEENTDEYKVYDSSENTIKSVIEGLNPELIIHAATCYGRENETIGRLYESNVIMPLNILNNIKIDAGVHFINLDTVLEKNTNYYSITKSHFLDVAKNIANTKKINFINLKIAYIYGLKSSIINKIIASARENNILELTPGEQNLDFIHIDDVVRAVCTVVEKLEKVSFNECEIGVGQTYKIKDIVEYIDKITKKNESIIIGSKCYRDNEILYYKANTEKINALGWESKIDLLEWIGGEVKKNSRIHFLAE